MVADSFDFVIEFVDELLERLEAIWSDSFGDWRFVFGEGVLLREIARLPTYRTIVANYVQCALPDCKVSSTNPIEYLVSVGAFPVHNLAKFECLRGKHKLITVPVPLSNDSFCTNRCNLLTANGNSSSLPCMFPGQTFVDLSLLQMVPPSANLLGLGEFIGLYLSVIDYSVVRNLAIPTVLLKFVSDWFTRMANLYSIDYERFLLELAAALVAKGLVMRVNRDHQIGCGIDHLLAYTFERELHIPHGQAVYLGSTISLVMFKEWEQFGILLKDLVSYGLRLGLITPVIMEQLRRIDLAFVIRRAIESRPRRLTVLRNVQDSSVMELDKLWAVLS